MTEPSGAAETPDEVELALSTLASSIKQKLVPSKRLEDPAVRIQLAMNKSTIQLLHQKGRSLGKQRGHEVYGINEYSDLNEVLGEQWHMRISNTSGDFLRYKGNCPLPHDSAQKSTRLQCKQRFIR